MHRSRVAICKYFLMKGGTKGCVCIVFSVVKETHSLWSRLHAHVVGKHFTFLLIAGAVSALVFRHIPHSLSPWPAVVTAPLFMVSRTMNLNTAVLSRSLDFPRQPRGVPSFLAVHRLFYYRLYRANFLFRKRFAVLNRLIIPLYIFIILYKENF